MKDRELMVKAIEEMYDTTTKIEAIQSKYITERQDLALTLSNAYVAYRDALAIPKVDGDILDPLDAQLHIEYHKYKSIVETLDIISQCESNLESAIDSMKKCMEGST